MTISYLSLSMFVKSILKTSTLAEDIGGAGNAVGLISSPQFLQGFLDQEFSAMRLAVGRIALGRD